MSQPVLGVAWCTVNQDVSTTLLGASKMEQFEDNIKALELVKKWDKSIDEKIEAIFGTKPDAIMNFRTWTPYEDRRTKRLVNNK